MPRDMVISDSDADAPRAKPKEYSSKKKRVSSSEREPDRASESEEAPGEKDEEEEEEEEEFEIEDVIDSQRGYFGDGKFGYFVKWKGYPSEDNSWVHEDDAANALDLINKYWENKRKPNKGLRKSTDAGKAKSGRKSTAAQETREPTPPPKKRGRAKKDEQEQSEKEQEREASSDSDATRAKKKPRKSQGSAVKKAQKQPAEEEEEDITVGSMKKHMTIPSWENLVETIDTIERGDDQNLYVYFKIKNQDARMRELSQLCAQRFPQKLIKFYESNLRWRIEGDDSN